MSSLIPEVLTLADGFRMRIYKWPCDAPQSAIILVHGMMDHAARYADFASTMGKFGISVLAFDLPGHGHTAAENQAPLGHWVFRQDLGRVDETITQLVSQARILTPGPVVLLGHSFGALLSQHWIQTQSALIDGLILSGPTHTAGKPRFLTAIGWAVARMATAIGLGKTRAFLLDRLTFLGFNRRCQPPLTRFDWLDADPAIVNAYCGDPFCGFVCTHALFADLYGLVLSDSAAQDMISVRMTLPVLMLSGSGDPLGNYLRDAARHAQFLRKVGFHDVRLNCYKCTRHETLLDREKHAVASDIRHWVQTLS